MDFGLEPIVAVAAPSGGAQASSAPAGAASPAEGDDGSFAAHLVDADPRASEEPVDTADGAPDPETNTMTASAAPQAPTPTPMLVQLLLAQGPACAEITTSAEAGEDAAQPATPPLGLTKPDAQRAADPVQSAPLSTAPTTAPLATSPEATPLADAAAQGDPSSIAAAGEATAASDAATTSAASLAIPLVGAKTSAKIAPTSKLADSETTTSALPAEASSDTDSGLAAPPPRGDAARQDPGENAANPGKGRAEPSIALRVEPVQAASASQPSAAAHGVAAPLSTAVDHGAPLAHVRSADAAPATAQVAQEIVRRFVGDTTHFEVRLDPPELGRVEVRLEVSRDNKVSATVIADSPQTLVELARHARELQNSLQSAGLDLADHGLSFDLRDSGREPRDARPEVGNRGSATEQNNTANSSAPLARAVGLDPWRGRTLDLTA
jgi:flagellar hook-length control protein FliK